MKEFSRVFNFGKTSYLYTENIGNSEETSTKMLSKRVHNSELNIDLWTPMYKESKYGENAFSYENFKNREIVFADNFENSSTFKVAKKIEGKDYKEKPIGNIKKGIINALNKDEHDRWLLKKIKGMIKKF